MDSFRSMPGSDHHVELRICRFVPRLGVSKLNRLDSGHNVSPEAELGGLKPCQSGVFVCTSREKENDRRVVFRSDLHSAETRISGLNVTNGMEMCHIIFSSLIEPFNKGDKEAFALRRKYISVIGRQGLHLWCKSVIKSPKLYGISA